MSREGIGALDPINGVPLTWNPGKDRGVGVFDIYLTTDGVYIGSDTDNVAGEWHPRFAMFPMTGGTVPPAPTPISLPADLYWGASTANTLSKAAYDGSTFGPTTTVSTPLTWSGGALRPLGGRQALLRHGRLDVLPHLGRHRLRARGEPEHVAQLDHRHRHGLGRRQALLHRREHQRYYRYFSLESGIVGSQTFTVSTSTDNASWSTTAGIFVTGNHLYQARTNGQLWRWTWSTPTSWPAPASWSPPPVERQGPVPRRLDDEPDLPPTVELTAPATGATVSGNAITVSATATDDDELDHVEFFTNGASIGVDTDGSNGWSVALGQHRRRRRPGQLTAAATDSADQTTVSAGRTVTVDNVGPAVSITAPASGATVSGRP